MGRKKKVKPVVKQEPVNIPAENSTPETTEFDPNLRAVPGATFYRVGYTGRTSRIITEIRRPEPEAVLILHTGDVVELTDAEVAILLRGEAGALIPADLLTPLQQDATDGEQGGEVSDSEDGPGESDNRAGSAEAGEEK